MNAWRHHGRFLACCRSRYCTRGWRGDVRFVARDLCVIASRSFSCGARPDFEDDQLGIVRVAECAEKSEWLTICQGRLVRECLCISILRVWDRELPRGVSNVVRASAVSSSESGSACSAATDGRLCRVGSLGCDRFAGEMARIGT